MAKIGINMPLTGSFYLEAEIDDSLVDDEDAIDEP